MCCALYWTRYWWWRHRPVYVTPGSTQHHALRWWHERDFLESHIEQQLRQCYQLGQPMASVTTCNGTIGLTASRRFSAKERALGGGGAVV
jgi:hypothetical protein